MRALALISVLFLVACGSGGDDTPAIDGNPAIDSPVGGPDAPAAAPTCATYCAKIAASCTIANSLQQYGSAATCMASCATWMQGVTGTMAGNSLACRDYHAGAAAASPPIHCRHAGPGGDDLCGTNCEGFCTLVLGVCIGGNMVYNNLGQCMGACAGFATTPAYSANVQTGNSLACRLYHGTAASTSAATHCPHTAVLSSQCL